MEEPNGEIYVEITTITIFNVLFSLVSHLVKEQLFLSESLVACLVGIGCGPVGLGWIRLGTAMEPSCSLMLYHLSRLVMAIQIMTAAVSLPKEYFRLHWRTLVGLLGPLMLLQWLVSSLLVKVFFWQLLSWRAALLIGACLAPTDPVLAQSVVRGRWAEEHVPLHLRLLLSAESGANDGVALPFLQFCLLSDWQDSSELLRWIQVSWIWAVLGSIAMGLVVGWAANQALRCAHRHRWVDKPSFLGFTLCLAMALTGTVTLLRQSDLLAIFMAGFMFEDARDSEGDCLQEFIDNLINLTFFVMLGSAIPWQSIITLGWPILALAVGILGLRRLPFLMLVPPAELSGRMERAFVGWFGPMGVGAIFYATLGRYHVHEPLLIPIVWAMVLVSVLAHGITAPLFHLSMLTRTLTFD